MNTIVLVLLFVIGLVLLPFVVVAILRAIWEVLEVPYRIVMLIVYGIAYLAVTVWEVLVLLVRVPFKIGSWVISRFHNQ